MHKVFHLDKNIDRTYLTDDINYFLSTSSEQIDTPTISSKVSIK